MYVPFLLLLAGLLSCTEAIVCYKGTETTNEGVACTFETQFANGSFRSMEDTPCCLRQVRGPSVRLGCAEGGVLCKDNNRCYRNDAPISPEGHVFERSFDCVCDSTYCNPALLPRPSLALLVFPALFFLASLSPRG